MRKGVKDKMRKNVYHKYTFFCFGFAKYSIIVVIGQQHIHLDIYTLQMGIVRTNGLATIKSSIASPKRSP